MKSILPILTVLLFTSCERRKPSGPALAELEMLARRDTVSDVSGTHFYSTRYFVVDPAFDEPERDTVINGFVRSFREKLTGDTIYSMTFYKRSDITNATHLKNSPADIDRYSRDHDLVWDFYFTRKGMERYKYKNGEIVSPVLDGVKVNEPRKP